MALVNQDNFFFYLMGSNVIQPSLDDPLLLQLQANNSLKSVSWGMWYCENTSDQLNNADQLFIWEGDGNLFANPTYTRNLISFANNGGLVGVTLGGNSPSSDNLVNPVDKLYNEPQDFILLLLSIKASLGGYLHFIDVDVENPQLNRWNEEHWVKLNDTLKVIRENPDTRNIQIRLTLPQTSPYWLGKKGYQALMTSGILKNTAIDYVNIMDMDKSCHSDTETWVNWAVQTAKDLGVSPEKTFVTFEADDSRSCLTTDLLVKVVEQLSEQGYHHYAIFTMINGVEKFKALTDG